MSIFNVIVLILSGLLILAICIPFIKNDYWVFRILEYPRYQKLILSCAVLAALIYTGRFSDTYTLINIILLGAGICYLLYKIWPYTALSRREMKTIKTGDTADQVKLFTGNVYQYNTSYTNYIQQVQNTGADIVFLLETNKKWETHADKLLPTHPYSLKKPLDNTYGLLFYSRYKIVESSILFRVDPEVPSIEAVIELPSGKYIKVFGLHPKPPVPGESDRSKSKDKELMKVAFKAKEEKLSVIVMGDLNDVAWSYVTELFRKTSQLLDPRRGRGFYSTFSAKKWLMRFPLDYVFCSNDFGLIDMKRMKPCGSDHFPMFSHFQLMPQLKTVQEEPHANASEKEEAMEKAVK